MFPKISPHWFTLVEIMTVVAIIGILATGLMMGTQPYMMRSRDTKRISDIQGYLNNVLGTYERNFDTFPSNYGSGWDFISTAWLWYCLSEVASRTFDNTVERVNISIREWKFSTLRIDTSRPPVDPLHQMSYPTLCGMTGSYVYSQLKYGVRSQLALIAARLEVKSSANYGTGLDLTDSGMVQNIIHAKRSSVPLGSPDQFFIVTALSE